MMWMHLRDIDKVESAILGNQVYVTGRAREESARFLA